MAKKERHPGRAALIVLGIATVIIVTLMTMIPRYKVWSREMHGKALLAEAEWSRQIEIEEAKARREAARELAAAEVERARGVAEANQIIGESLKENEQYLRYLWIQGLQDGSSEVIYIPTEAGMPILEAGKRD
jgi:regulator of protease activity HflC (stomatin/prohibitin superfamily)